MAENFSDKISDMLQVPQTHEFYEFAQFRLDVKKQRLWRGEELVALTPKEFELLLILIVNAGRVVEKDDLHEKIWKDTFVEDGTLTRNISWLRKKLGAGNTGGEKFIETIPKRGYRFLPEVTRSSAENALVVEEQTRTRIRIEETLILPEIREEEKRRRGEKESMLAVLPAENKIAALPKISSSPPLKWLFAILALIAAAAIAFVVYQNYFQKATTKIVFAGRVVPFAGLTGIEAMPAFSPDSKQIVFGWNGGEGEILDVYVKIIGASEPVRLTKGATNSYFPVFAPDSRSVAFFRSSPETSVIFSVSALGGAERKICDVQSGGTSFSFAPDGKTIVTADRDAETGANGIFFVNVETGAKTRLTQPPENFTDNTPRFSPDGKFVVFVRSGGWANQDLFIAPTTGGGEEARRLTLDGNQLFGAAWSADGGRIIYSSARGESSVNLWQIRAAGGEEPELLLAGGKNPKTPVVAPDGKSIAFVEETQDSNIWRLQSNAATTGGRAAATTSGEMSPRLRVSASPRLDSAGDSDFKKFIASTRADHSPNISPDGNRIVFVSLRTGDSGVWAAAADGSNLLQIAVGNAPRISPDGKFVVFNSPVADRDAIHVVGIEGGARRTIVADKNENNLPSWSADGRFVYFQSNHGGDFNLWRIRADGAGEAVRITRNGAFESFAAPDDEWIYYSKDRETVGLWRVSIDGDPAEQTVPELAEAGFRRSWTMTKKGIYFVARAEQMPYKIKFYDFSNHQTSEIATTDTLPVSGFPGLGAATDGKTILYARDDQNATAIMLAELGK